MKKRCQKEAVQACLGLWPKLSGTKHPSSAHHGHGSPALRSHSNWCFREMYCLGSANASCCLQMPSNQLEAPKKILEAATKRSGFALRLQVASELHLLCMARLQLVLLFWKLARPLWVRRALPAAVSIVLSSAMMHKGDASQSLNHGPLPLREDFFQCWHGCSQCLPFPRSG